MLSAVVRHFTRGMAPVTMVCKAKTPAPAWGATNGEVGSIKTPAASPQCSTRPSLVCLSAYHRARSTLEHHVNKSRDCLLRQDFLEFRGGHLVTGTLDKAQFGSYGLVHSVQVTRLYCHLHHVT